MVLLGGLETGDGWQDEWMEAQPQNNKDPVNPDNGLLKSALRDLKMYPQRKNSKQCEESK